jgi:hypothetical protein
MNPSLLGAAAATLLVTLWLVTRRKPRPFLRSDDTSAVAALNRAQRERVCPAPATLPMPGPQATTPQPAGSGDAGAAPLSFGGQGSSLLDPTLPRRSDPRGRALLLARLTVAAQGPLPNRLEAMRTARRWGHPAVLPLLRRGLRDVHPSVVREAALALEGYRGRTVPAPGAPARISRRR